MPQDELIEQIKSKLQRPVVLVGMMGVGKSHLGKSLAKALDLKFTDSDRLIEKRAGYSIADIFELFGEEKFRLSEARIIRELIDQGGGVIATGGGAVMNDEVRRAMLEKSVVVWLRAERAELVKRLEKSRNRPLLKKGNISDVIDGLMEKRMPYYSQSHIIVDSVTGSVPKTLESVINSLCDYLKKG